MTPREKYHNDNHYCKLVDMMVAHIESCNYTPSEMREAAILASILYEEHHMRSFTINTPYPVGVISALKTIHEYVTDETLSKEKNVAQKELKFSVQKLEEPCVVKGRA